MKYLISCVGIVAVTTLSACIIEVGDDQSEDVMAIESVPETVDGAADMAAAFTLKDQDDKEHSFSFPHEKVLVFSVADAGGSKDAPLWREKIKEEFGERIDFQPMASLGFIPILTRPVARMGVKAASGGDIILCDWEGSVSEQLGAETNMANIIVVAPSGEIVHRVTQTPTDEKVAATFEAIETAIPEELSEQ